MYSHISERVLGEKLGGLFAEDGIFLKYVTTDGDTCTDEGVSLVMQELAEDWVVLRQADTTHLCLSTTYLGQSQFKHTSKASFNDCFFQCQCLAVA